MHKKQQRLCRAIERAGIRASKKEGHLLDREELLHVKVQVMPAWMRVILGAGGLWCVVNAYQACSIGTLDAGILYGLAAMLLAGFSIWGIRKTCRATLEGLDAATSADLLGLALERIAHGVGALFDGL